LVREVIVRHTPSLWSVILHHPVGRSRNVTLGTLLTLKAHCLENAVNAKLDFRAPR